MLLMARRVASTNCCLIVSMSARVMASGVWFCSPYGWALAAITGQLVSAFGRGSSVSSQPTCVEPLGPLWPSWMPMGIGETLRTEVWCMDKEIKKDRKWVRVRSETRAVGSGELLFSGIMTTLVAH